MNLQSLGLVSAAIAPAVIFLGGITLRPRYPWWSNTPLVAGAVLAGCAAAFAALAVEAALTVQPWTITNLGGLAFFTLAGVGLVEEGAKFLLLRAALWRFSSFQEAYDGIILATAVGLGFGATENISYVLDSGYEVALARAFTAVPLHGMLGVILGFYLGQAKVWEVQEGKPRWGLLGTGLALAALGHGFYDFLAFQSSPVAETLLWGSLATLALWSWRLVVRSRQWSPSWGGGSLPFEEPHYVAPPLTPRAPWLAALLGLIPGLGQLYNREWQKGAYLMAVGGINILVLLGLWFLVSDPQTALLTLLGWGLLLGPDPAEFVGALQQSPALPLMGTLMFSLSVLGAVDAYWVARNNRFDYLEAPSLRVSWLQSVALAYAGHLLAAVFLVLIPILGGGGGQQGKEHKETSGTLPLVFDLVSEPTTLLGHDERPVGRPEGKDKENRREKPSVKAPSTLGLGQKLKPQTGESSQTAKGVPHSYNDYISGELRREQEKYDLYFSRLLPGEYTVVQYRVSSSGEIYDVQVLAEHTTAPPYVAQLAVEEVLRLNPLLPPPTQGRELMVTELFWQYEQVGAPGSLEDRLSRLPDGRQIEVLE
ncbi:PrsW family intramembrane metalloprotease [Anthocerotibacter panamensis]|uniref:PrsW family intramembrane metalloprotease n=1 Tax=Anthocerotibacter panamensis TaxID=2857077 RepID=UPI001C4028CF|nr:PrsW family intramembrane metalloprotease [Anthocerotibacter panamensis]